MSKFAVGDRVRAYRVAEYGGTSYNEFCAFSNPIVANNKGTIVGTVGRAIYVIKMDANSKEERFYAQQLRRLKKKAPAAQAAPDVVIKSFAFVIKKLEESSFKGLVLFPHESSKLEQFDGRTGTLTFKVKK